MPGSKSKSDLKFKKVLIGRKQLDGPGRFESALLSREHRPQVQRAVAAGFKLAARPLGQSATGQLEPEVARPTQEAHASAAQSALG